MTQSPHESLLLQSMLDRLESIEHRIVAIADTQAVIGSKVDIHIASTTKSTTESWLAAVKPYAIPLALALFLAGANTNEGLHATAVRISPKATADCTSVDSAALLRKAVGAKILKTLAKSGGP